MTNQIAIRDDQQVAERASQITNVQRVGHILAASGYFADAREMAQAAVKVMAGEELGIPPVAAMMGIHLIKGKIALSGNLIASRIRAHGYEYRHKRFDATGCVLEFLSKMDAAGKRTLLGESSFTEEDAKLAGVYSDMYRKFPRNMYFNRAISNGAKWYTPEVFAGAPVYVAEELGAQIDEQGDYIAPECGSVEAAQAVAERKIAEMRPRTVEMDPAPQPSAEELHADIVAHPPKEPRKPSKSLAARHIDMLQAFGGLKKRYLAIGAEKTYYAVLGRFGAEKSNEFPATDEGLRSGLACYREMQLNVSDVEAMRAKEAAAGTSYGDWNAVREACGDEMAEELGLRVTVGGKAYARESFDQTWTVTK